MTDIRCGHYKVQFIPDLDHIPLCTLKPVWDIYVWKYTAERRREPVTSRAALRAKA